MNNKTFTTEELIKLFEQTQNVIEMMSWPYKEEQNSELESEDSWW